MKKHQERMAAKLANQLNQTLGANDSGANPPVQGLMEAKQKLALYQAALNLDLARLSDLNSKEQKRDLKTLELLPKYLPYVESFKESGQTFANPIVAYCLVWLFDCDRFDDGFELANYMIATGQSMPERFKSDVQTFVCDAIKDWAEAQQKAGHSSEPYLSQIIELISLPDGQPAWVVHEDLQGKLYKLLGYQFYNAQQYSEAVEAWEKAQHLYSGAGVKTILEKVKKLVKA